MEFRCVSDCSQCCIEREYFPSKEYGKIGVLILPEEVGRIKRLARKNGINVSIVPRIGVSGPHEKRPSKIIAHQMMGKDQNGNTCPFLDTGSSDRSEHGGYVCKIYRQRPLACAAYPLIETNPAVLDEKCKFCRENGNADENLDSETESLLQIREKMTPDSGTIWRYATGVCEEIDRKKVKTGWIKQ